MKYFPFNKIIYIYNITIHIKSIWNYINNLEMGKSYMIFYENIKYDKLIIYN